MRAPFDQSQHLQPVDDATKRDRLDFEKLRESLLINAVVLREVGRSLPLRPGKAGSGGVFLEPLFHWASYVVQQETKRG